MELYFLSNSGFALLLDKSMLVFDYFRDVPANGQRCLTGGVMGKSELACKQRVYVFASHMHPDHFNPRIFAWQEEKEDICYLLDEGIRPKAQPAKHAVFLKKGDVYQDEQLLARAFGSTDIGISFYLEIEGLKLFHAGDLNLWHWKDEADSRYVQQARQAFFEEMQEIRDAIGELDLAFFPVDARMGSEYDEGALYFVETMKPKVLIPMHSGNYQAFRDFAAKAQTAQTKILCPEYRGQRLI